MYVILKFNIFIYTPMVLHTYNVYKSYIYICTCDYCMYVYTHTCMCKGTVYK
jgi:hypothetical protein